MARSFALILFVLSLVSLAQAGCVVRETRPGRCEGGAWVEGHYGPRGRWHEGHWRCPGRREIIEVD